MTTNRAKRRPGPPRQFRGRAGRWNTPIGDDEREAMEKLKKDSGKTASEIIRNLVLREAGV